MRLVTMLGTLFYLVLSTSNAYAYLDPGTGSILLQGLIGAIATGMFMAKLYWAKFISILGIGPSNSKSTNQDKDPNA